MASIVLRESHKHTVQLMAWRTATADTVHLEPASFTWNREEMDWAEDVDCTDIPLNLTVTVTPSVNRKTFRALLSNQKLAAAINAPEVADNEDSYESTPAPKTDHYSRSTLATAVRLLLLHIGSPLRLRKPRELVVIENNTIRPLTIA